MQHILECDKNGWMLIHCLSCPGNLLNCELTMMLRDATEPPFTGIHEVWSKKRARDGTYRMVVGDPIPFGYTPPTSRRTGYVWKQENAGIPFGTTPKR